MNSYEDPALSYECDLTAQRDRLRRQNTVMRATLTGLRGMAEIEAADGSQVWRKAIPMIDAALADKGDA